MTRATCAQALDEMMGFPRQATRARDCPTRLQSKLLDPRPEFHLKRPRAARLRKHIDVSLGNGIGRKKAVRTIRRRYPALAFHSTVNHEVRHMYALGAQLARHALREPPEPELARRECRR